MSRKPFRFKKFNIFQDKTAMKVGTDGVLLGSWADAYHANRILDIGTGTGLIAMMLTQRFPNSFVDALEIDRSAYLQAKENFENSIFSHRLAVYNKAIQNYHTDKKYDSIVSNPPFFGVNDLVEPSERKKAREQETLTFVELLEKTQALLAPTGVASFIIPYSQKDSFVSIAIQNSLYLGKIMYIKGNKNTVAKRVLLEFSFQEKKIAEGTLIIELDRHQYTEEYVNLTKDFYIKM